MKIINIGTDFYHRLANRDKKQGDGLHHAIEFREKYLQEYDNDNAWVGDNSPPITFDFSEVSKIGPSFANEAFAYFTRYATPAKILSKFLFANINPVFKIIIDQEVDFGYRGKFNPKL